MYEPFSIREYKKLKYAAAHPAHDSDNKKRY